MLSCVKTLKDNQMSQVPPVVLSTIVCDRVLFDAPTRTNCLIGIRDCLFAPKYPVRIFQLFFFAEMTNGHDTTDIIVRLVDVQNDEKVLIEKKANVKFENVKSTVSVVLGFEGLAFEHPGEYCFQLIAAGQPLSSRRINCILIKPPQAGENAPQNPNT